MNEEERTQMLERLLSETAEMRKYQVLYFKNKLQGDLRLAKRWEQVVDGRIKQLSHPLVVELVQDRLL
jgi:hypothetical protein